MACQGSLFRERQASHMRTILRDLEEMAEADIAVLKGLSPNHEEAIGQYREKRLDFIRMFKSNFDMIDRRYAGLLDENLADPGWRVSNLPDFISDWNHERHHVIGEYYQRRETEFQEFVNLILGVSVPVAKKELPIHSRATDFKCLRHS